MLSGTMKKPRDIERYIPVHEAAAWLKGLALRTQDSNFAGEPGAVIKIKLTISYWAPSYVSPRTIELLGPKR